MEKTIRVLLVDDHQIMRKGIESTLETFPHIQIVGEAANGEDAIREASRLHPDIVLMDISMPRVGGIEAVERLIKADGNTKVIALSMHDSKEHVIRMIRAGALGYVLKDASCEDLAQAIEEVHRGKAFFSPQIAPYLIQELVDQSTPDRPREQNPLTSREIEVLKHLAEGRSNKEIASLLGLGVRTIETHREKIGQKLEIKSVAGLTRYALENGLI